MPAQIPYGKAYYIKGNITSDSPITKVTVNIFSRLDNAQSLSVQESAYPNSYSYNLSDIDSRLHFTQYPTGHMEIQIWAVNSAGAYELYRDEFEIVGGRNITKTEVSSYKIPDEALKDIRFSNMINEANKYLGYPYVWGGNNPNTSFDCSGFVCWVINNCGNGWKITRTTAEGLRKSCEIIPESSAKPGDLIFFEKTYDTVGASHVGIYVGDGMMLHCGDPISYASIKDDYWTKHFLCFGRIKN